MMRTPGKEEKRKWGAREMLALPARAPIESVFFLGTNSRFSLETPDKSFICTERTRVGVTKNGGSSFHVAAEERSRQASLAPAGSGAGGCLKGKPLARPSRAGSREIGNHEPRSESEETRRDINTSKPSTRKGQKAPYADIKHLNANQLAGVGWMRAKPAGGVSTQTFEIGCPLQHSVLPSADTFSKVRGAADRQYVKCRHMACSI